MTETAVDVLSARRAGSHRATPGRDPGRPGPRRAAPPAGDRDPPSRAAAGGRGRPLHGGSAGPGDDPDQGRDAAEPDPGRRDRPDASTSAGAPGSTPRLGPRPAARTRWIAWWPWFAMSSPAAPSAASWRWSPAGGGWLTGRSGDRGQPALGPGGVGRLQPPLHGRSVDRGHVHGADRRALRRPRPAGRGLVRACLESYRSRREHPRSAHHHRRPAPPDPRAHRAAGAPRQRRPSPGDGGLAGPAGAGATAWAGPLRPSGSTSASARLPRPTSAGPPSGTWRRRRLYLARPRIEARSCSRWSGPRCWVSPSSAATPGSRPTTWSGSWRSRPSGPSWSASRSIVAGPARRSGRANWHIVKWNHLRTFLAPEPLDLAALEPYLGLDRGWSGPGAAPAVRHRPAGSSSSLQSAPPAPVRPRAIASRGVS